MEEKLDIQLGLRVTRGDLDRIDVAVKSFAVARRQDVARHALRLGLSSIEQEAHRPTPSIALPGLSPPGPRGPAAGKGQPDPRRQLYEAADQYVEALLEGLELSDGVDIGTRRGRRTDREIAVRQRDALDLLIEEARTIASTIYKRERSG